MSSKSQHKTPYLIGICGGSASGKTTVANQLLNYLGSENCLLFSMDTYYKNLTPEQEQNLSEYNFDTPDALDLDLINEHLSSLMSNKSIEMPTYDFATNKRMEKTVHLESNKFIIFEGILSLYDERIRNMMSLKIFIDLDSDLKFFRRIYRDIVERGRNTETVVDRYLKFVKPAYDFYIYPTREYADIIIPRGAENTTAIDMIKMHLNHEIIKIEGKNNSLKIFEEKNNENSVKNVNFCEIFDEKYSIICDNVEKKKYFLMMKNMALKEKNGYFWMYMKVIMRKIYENIEDKKYAYILNDITDFEEFKIIINKISNPITLTIFIPVFLEDNSALENAVFTALENNSIKSIVILSVFLLTKNVEKYNKNRIKVQSVFCTNEINHLKEMFLIADYTKENCENFSRNLIFLTFNYEEKLKNFFKGELMK